MKAQHFSLPMALLLLFVCTASTVWWQRSAAQAAPLPLSLAAGDFDEDGMPDLVSGFGENARGQLRISRGRVTAIFPMQKPSAKVLPAASPFEATSAAIALPLAPELLGVGDFDADGHLDIVAGARGNDFLVWLRGNGRGEFKRTSKVPLPGTLTTFAAGAVNRADGLTDVAVGVVTPSGARLLVYEGATGAFQHEPEQFPLPDAANDLALATFDNDELFDLAVAAGQQLLLIRGRDRRLAQDPEHQVTVPPATIDQHTVSNRINALAVGDFNGQQRHELALWLADGTLHVWQPTAAQPWHNWPSQALPRLQQLNVAQTAAAAPHRLISARVAASDTDQLIALDASNQQLVILGNQVQPLTNRLALRHSLTADDSAGITFKSAPVALMPLRLNSDALSDLVILRAGSVEPEFVLTTPQNTFTVTNYGAGAGSFEQAIRSANASPGLDQIVFNLPNPPPNNTFSSLPVITDAVVIDGTTQPGYAGAPLLEISFCANNPSSVLSITGGNTTVRGFAIHSCGIRGSFSQVGNGIYISERGNNIIEANYLGVNRSGDCQLSFGNCGTYNTNGVFIQRSTNNLIGGTTAAARNLISGNLVGVYLAEEARDNRVQGNFIGPDITGNKLVGSETGVYVFTNGNNLIGGTVAGARNLITAVRLIGIGLFRATGTLVQGNYIGTDAAGVTGSPLANMVNLTEAPRNVIGGASPNARNIIAGGIFLADGSDETAVLGNYIGVDTTGNKFLGGTILVQSRANSIGGVSAGARNLIASGMLIRFETSRNNTVQGNYIGVNASGTAALKDYGPVNVGVGVEIFNSADNQIGGTSLGAGNLLSGLPAGVNIYGQSASGNRVLGNLIGTQADGTSPLGNRDVGIQTVVTGTLIGGVEPGAGNVIAFNGTGVRGGIIRGNSIHSNIGLGIDCCDNGVSVNVLNENNNSSEHQNAPRLTLALVNAAGNSLTVQGRLNSYAGSNFQIDLYANPLCDPSGYGEGRTYLGSANLTTGADFNGTFTVTLPVNVSAGQFITATATRANVGTSEFSPCVAVATGCLSVYPLSDQLSNGNILIPRTGGIGSLGISTQGTCSWTASSTANWITFTNGTSGNGNGTINFSVAANPGVASRVGVINIGTQRATVVQAGQVAVVSAASFSNSEFTYRGIYAVFGQQLAANNQTATSVPLPTSLAGTTAYLTDQRLLETVQLPLFFVSPGQINLLFDNLAFTKFAGPATLTVISGNGGVATGEVTIRDPIAGGLFAANASGQGFAAGVALRVKANGAQTFEPVVRLDVPPNRYAAVPIDLGPETDKVFLILFGTGIGNAGQVVQIGNNEIQPDYLGPQGSLAGVDQVNALLPRALLGRGEVDVKIYNPQSTRASNTVRVNIK